MNSKLTAAISARILAALNTGMTLPQAFDSVLGAGAYAKLAGEVFDTLNP